MAESTTPVSMRMPDDLMERVRLFADLHHTSSTQIVIEALRVFLDDGMREEDLKQRLRARIESDQKILDQL